MITTGTIEDKLNEETRAAMIRYARYLLGKNFSESDAEDAVQSAFLEAWRDLPALREPKAFPAWLRRIVFKQCDRLRRSRRTVAIGGIPGENHDGIPDPSPDPCVELTVAAENADQARGIRRAANSLPPGEKIAVLLYYWGGGSCQDVATFLGISTTALKSRLHSARRRLKERVNGMEPITDRTSPIHSGTLETLTDIERTNVLQAIEDCYRRFADAFEVQDPALVLPLFTDDYELIFPQERNQPIWDKARVERDVRKCGIQPPGRLRIRVLLDELLSVERDPMTGVLCQATARATFIDAGGRNQPPVSRIDTFARIGTEWKLRRTLGLGT